MTQHPIPPPPKLVDQWCDPRTTGSMHFDRYDLAARAAQWGADQELEACLNWMIRMGYWGDDGKAIPALRAARRPKPPSLKEQALEDLHIAFDTGCFSERQADTIRRALEQLDD